jgi:predicted phage terminase large subunit-like protein
MAVTIPEMAEDFTVFLEIIFPYIGMTAHPCQVEFANFIAQPEERLMAMAQRDMGKSNIVSAYICWELYRDPERKILVCSASEKRAKDLVRQAKAMIKSVPLLSHMAPNKNDLDGELRFDVGNRKNKAAKDPSVAAYGMNAGMTGAHAHTIITDDIEIPENSMTPEARDKIRERVRGLESIINDGDDCKILIIGTPQTMESMYFELIEEAIYDLYRVPAKYPETLEDMSGLGIPGWVRDNLESGRAQPGDPTYPERFPPEELAKREARMGRSMFTLQFQLDPSAADSEKFPLKLKDLIVMDLGTHEAPPRVVWGSTEPIREIKSPGIGADQFYRPMYYTNPKEWIPYEQGVMWIDPAGYGGDQVGYAIVKTLGGNAYVLRAGGLDGGYSDATIKKLLSYAQECGIKRIVVEKNWSDGLYAKQITNIIAHLGIKISVDGELVKGQKESRIIDTLEPVMNAHRMIVDQSVARNKELMYQLSHITRERGCLRKDDQVDALAGAIQALQGSLFRNTEQAVEEYEQKEFMATVEEFMKTTGQTPAKKTHTFISRTRSKAFRR